MKSFFSVFQVVKLSEIVTLAKQAQVDVKFQLPIWSEKCHASV